MFGSQEVEYLRFIIKNSGVAINRHKTKAIEDWHIPTSRKDMQSFLGLVNHYRRSIQNFSEIAKLLTELTKNVLFMWSKNAEDSFRNLEQKVTTVPLLRTFHQDYPVIVTTDASKKASGAVLEQDGLDGHRPVAFTSRTLNAAEQNDADTT